MLVKRGPESSAHVAPLVFGAGLRWPQSFRLDPKEDSSRCFYRELRDALGYAPRAVLPMDDVSIETVGLRQDDLSRRQSRELGLEPFPVVCISNPAYRCAAGWLEGYFNIGEKRRYSWSTGVKEVVKFNLNLARIIVGRDQPLVLQEPGRREELIALGSAEYDIEHPATSFEQGTYPYLTGQSEGRQFLPVLSVNPYMTKDGITGLIINQTTVQKDLWDALMGVNARLCSPSKITALTEQPATEVTEAGLIANKIGSNNDLLAALQKRGIRSLEERMVYLPQVILTEELRQKLSDENLTPPSIIMVAGKNTSFSLDRALELSLDSSSQLSRYLGDKQFGISVGFVRLLKEKPRWKVLLHAKAEGNGRGVFDVSERQGPGVYFSGSRNERHHILFGADKTGISEHVLVMLVDFQRIGSQRLSVNFYPTRFPKDWRDGLTWVNNQLGSNK